MHGAETLSLCCVVGSEVWHPICKQAARAEKKLKVGSRERGISERWHVPGDVAPKSLLEVNCCGSGQARGGFLRLARALSPLPRGWRVAVAVRGDLPHGWHQPVPQLGRGHSSPLTDPLYPSSSAAGWPRGQLPTGLCQPGHSPDSDLAPREARAQSWMARAACHGRGHWQQADERADELDLERNSAPKPAICLLCLALCLLGGPSSLCSHPSSASLPPQHRRTSETSISPPGSSIGSPNRVICVSTAQPLARAGQDGCSGPRGGSRSSRCCSAV